MIIVLPSAPKSRDCRILAGILIRYLVWVMLHDVHGVHGSSVPGLGGSSGWSHGVANGRIRSYKTLTDRGLTGNLKTTRSLFLDFGEEP